MMNFTRSRALADDVMVPYAVLRAACKCFHPKLVAGWILLTCIGVTNSTASVFPRGTNLTSLVVIKENDLGSTAEGVMIATLQGVVAKQSGNQIYIVGSSAG